ncbi:DUF4870 domain-containing protein [Candidatus Pacearchaeota archaeon]|nr:DUF4870 domain-containing protein [Candidatus Pacearchaeota archaeon]
MVKKQNKNSATTKKDDSTLFAFLATFLSIVGFVIALVTKREDKYVMFYAKQSLVLFIVYVVAWVVAMVLIWIPIIGWIIMWAIYVLLLILWIISWINALSGQEKEIPIVGQYAKKFNI